MLRGVLICAVIAACASVASAQPRSLVRGGGFEAALLAWSPTGDWAVDDQAAHSGKHALRARVAADSATDAMAVQNIPAQPGKTYTCALWIRTQDVQPLSAGGFAFAAIYQFDVADQLVTFTDFAKVTGTRDWARFTFTFTVQARAERVAIHCGIYRARGAAWFDDFVVTPGDSAPEWSPAMEAPAMAQRGDAVAILKDDLPASGAASSPDDLAALLRRAGIAVEFLDARGLADPAQLNVDRCDLVVLPYGASFPAPAAKTFQKFLAAGGDFISVGGYAFDNLLDQTAQGWRPHEEVAQAQARPLPIGGDFEGRPRWKTDTPQWAQIVPDVAHSGKRSARVSLPPGEYAGAEWYQDFAPTPGKALHVEAWVKAAELRREANGYAFAAAYQYDADGHRLDWHDFATVTAKQDWKRYEYDFTPAPGCARLRLRLGLYNSSGTAWFDDVKVTERDPPIWMNTRHGDPRDGLGVSPWQIGVFDPTYRLQRAAYAAAAPRGPLAGVRWSGPLEGYAACAVTGADQARWTPLINAYDRFGRLRGAVGSLTRHYAGVYRGSNWACFGVANQDVFAKGRARDAFVPLVRAMLRETCLHNVATNWACYREGETVTLSGRISNSGRQEREVTPAARVVRVGLDDRDENAGQAIAVANVRVLPGATAEFAATWTAEEPGLYRLEVELRAGDDVIDRVVTGCVVKGAPAGPKIAWQGNYLALDGKPRFLLGTDTYANMFASANQNPWTWHEAAKKMRAHEVLVFENLQVNPEAFAQPYVADEKFLRQAEAMVELAGRNGLIYDAGLLIGFNVLADDATLAKQVAWCRQWAERMRDRPALLHYLNGDLQIRYAAQGQPDDAGPLWRGWLRDKYGDITALNAAWQTPFASFEEMPLAPASPRGWDDLQARDRRLFEVAMVRRWLGALNRALKPARPGEADPSHPTTVEFYQLPWSGIDPRQGMDALDIGNIGYFGLKGEDLSKFPSTFAFTDLRASGQGLSVGEFGVKTHPAWESVRGNYHTARTEAEQFDLFLAIPHYAFGLGGCKVQNWCWEDADENIFPWGLNYPNDRVSKDALDVYRNVGMLLGRFEPAYQPPAVWLVVPTSHRLSAASGEPVYAAALRALDALIGAHVAFGVIDEERLDLLPPQAKALFWPVPFCPGDAAYQAVLRFARQGGTAYVSGDLSFDPDRKRTRTARLEELAGVRFVKENYLGLAAGPASRVRITGALGAVSAWQAAPCIVVEARGGEVLADAGGSPLLVRHAVGAGQVIFSADPLEARPEAEPTLAALYRAVLTGARIEPIGVEPDRESIHAFAAPTREGGTVYVLYNADPKRRQTVALTTPHGRFTLALGAHKPGLIALSREGRLLAVEATGEVTRDGRPVARGDCHFAWFTDEETDLSEARGSILTTLSKGRVRLNARGVERVCAYGWGGEGWQVLEQMKPQRDGDWLTLAVDEDLARQVVALGEATVR